MDKLIHIEFTKPDPAKIKFPIVSWLIRLFQRSKYSHVRLRWQSTSGVEIIYEASGSEVKVIGELSQQDHPIEVVKSYTVKVSRDQYRALIRLFRYAGVKYGYLQILGIALVTIFKLAKNPFSDGRKSQVCSELVGLFITEVKKWDLPLDLDIAGPKEIDQQFAKLKIKHPTEFEG